MRLGFSCSAMLLAVTSVLTATVLAQRGGSPQTPTPRAQAPVDITGYWVSLVTEDWRYRITTPPKGDVAGVPLNGAGRQVALAWDAAKDEAAGESCKAYGAAGLMREPGRLHITWTNDDTLSLEADAGTQTRTIPFRGPRGTGGDWQGLSIGSWDRGESTMARGGLDDEAVRALRDWRFRPTLRVGAPVPTRIDLEMRFALR